MALVAAACALALPAGAAAQGPGNGSWRPGPAKYGMSSQRTDVRMSDGISLNATVTRPTDPASGRPAPGRFPVILTATPYGKDEPGVAGVDDTPAQDYVPYGYLHVLVDVRGTGSSGGDFQLMGPREVADYVELIRWVARLPGSNGRVGMVGESYLGENELAAAGAVGPHSPLKAIFPVFASPDLYRDISVPGGLFNNLFDTPYAGLEIGMDTLGPLSSSEPPSQVAQNLGLHLEGNAEIDGQTLSDAFDGGDRAYDQDFWQRRDLSQAIARIPRNGVAVLAYNALFDIFQRGDPLVYSILQNAAAHRNPLAAMKPGQRTDGRYQVVLGPYFHIDAGPLLEPLLGQLSLEWFDTWLKRKRTGMDHSRAPLHAYELEGGRWLDLRSWPTAARPTTWYFAPGPSSSGAASRNDGRLTPAVPSASGSDDLPWNGTLTSPCSRQTYQQANAVLLLYAPYDNPCIYDDRTFELNGLTYTSAPFTQAEDIIGPGDVTVYATANTANTEWVATISIVSPDGAARPVTTGDLIGSLRARDDRRSWRLGGRLLMPFHSYSRASERPVPAGSLERYDLDLSGTVAHLRRGDRVRVTIQSSDSPYLQPTMPDSTQLMGGSYGVTYGGPRASSLTLPLVPAAQARTSAYSWGPCKVDCG